MLRSHEQWQVAIATIEALYEDILEWPLSESVFICIGELIFNPKKPLDDEVKRLVVATFNLIYRS